MYKLLMIIVLTLSSIVSKAQVDSVGTRKLMMNINGSALKIPYFSNHSLDTTDYGIANAEKLLINAGLKNLEEGNTFTHETPFV